MAELEIHHEGGHDPLGQKVGILAAVIAAGLALVTIASHRAHTAAVVEQTRANDEWSFYQSKRLKAHNLELGHDLIQLLGTKSDTITQAVERYGKDTKRYEADAEKIRQVAEQHVQAAEHQEDRALRFDFGEGLLEIGLVLSSLFFISKKTFFPIIGLIAGIIGGLLGASGWFV